MKRVLFALLLILTFLSAAKTHGRQYRLERELKGYWTVSFTTRNDPWVEELWLKQRVMYWSVAVITAIVITGKRLSRLKGKSFKPINWIIFTVRIALETMITAFVVMGLASAMRLALNLAGGASVPSVQWHQMVIWGSIGWWSLTAALIFITRLMASYTQRAQS